MVEVPVDDVSASYQDAVADVLTAKEENGVVGLPTSSLVSQWQPTRGCEHY